MKWVQSIVIGSTTGILMQMYFDQFCVQIYGGKVTSLMAFGCFVQLEGLQGRHEGLVHVSQVCDMYCTLLYQKY